MKWLDLFRQPEPNFTPAKTASADVGRLDLGSETWVYVREWASAEIERLREKNDASLDTATTEALRGQIKAHKRLLALGKPKADTRRLSVEED